MAERLISQWISFGSIALATGMAGATVAAANAAETYPSGVVTVVTHSSPGGGSDVFWREMIPHLQPHLGGKLIVQNVTGGSGAKAVATVADATPDGSMFYATTPTYIYTSLLANPTKTYKDLEPLVNLFYDPEVIYTAANSKFSDLKSVIAEAKSGRGKWGAANPASLEREALEEIKAATGANASIVTFEGGGDMLLNVLNGSLDIGVGEVEEIRSQLDAKKLRVLAVIGDNRLDLLPDVPTAKEEGVDVSVVKFRGLAGPKNLPPEVISAWEKAAQELVADPDYKKIYEANNLQPGYIAHDRYVKFIDDFAQKTEGFLKESGVVK
ncbi:tripartite tricarboxylate transporter substrate binding protein [Mangrovibrevibacter kandeliae]|uniref:tripartite tricarboxylate transporter substrate binding protein n=1 Tax=Mangrovibrevibacter kandeliae TaxID=2968473 RepID=UPI002117AB5D|nr:tripartite tricarboxylate transporter substrate binding protein [Aurantimonas sp. CSK15Z-1]MCQ8781208.1 tripartite tricarboxylate transporter substrate binding protein [Aurantimonas sp. CSK15Z-1]